MERSTVTNTHLEKKRDKMKYKSYLVLISVAFFNPPDAWKVFSFSSSDHYYYYFDCARVDSSYKRAKRFVARYDIRLFHTK